MSKNKAELYLDAILTQAGVVYVQGAPGLGKTACLEQLALENDFRYMDLRLSMVAEEDFMIPTIVDGVIKTAIPQWAIDANKQPTLVVFEELNRASLGVRNASLQILLERRIGPFFKFNKDVYFVATGNLGEEDGTEVEDFDKALNNRLIHFKFTMSVPEWVNGFAKENVHPVITSFLENRPEHFYKVSDCSAYATPRSWTHFSKLIERKVGKNMDLKTIKDLANSYGSAYVGISNVAFIQYLENMELVSINDVLDDFKKASKVLKTLNRDILSSLLNGLKEMNIDNFDVVQFENAVSFIKMLSEDEQVSYFHHINKRDINEPIKKNSNTHKLLTVHFNDLREKIINMLD